MKRIIWWNIALPYFLIMQKYQQDQQVYEDEMKCLDTFIDDEYIENDEIIDLVCRCQQYINISQRIVQVSMAIVKLLYLSKSIQVKRNLGILATNLNDLIKQSLRQKSEYEVLANNMLKTRLRKEVQNILDEGGYLLSNHKVDLDWLIAKEENLCSNHPKYPEWTGKHLEKIDLSKTIFEDYVWCNANFANTNACIDFKKSYEYKKDGHLKVSNCDFTNVDLANNDFNDISYIADTSLAYTNLQINSLYNTYGRLKIYNCSLEGLDLSRLSIKVSDIFLNSFHSNLWNFRWTGIKVVNDIDDLDSIKLKVLKEMGFSEDKQELQIIFQAWIDKGIFDGCNIDNKYKLSNLKKLVFKKNLNK